ncbi:Protein FAR1-RELATED SEQUENCE 5, partial [Mucuna pruriens]
MSMKQLDEIDVCYHAKVKSMLHEGSIHFRNAYMKLDINVIQFFKHFKRAVDEKRYNKNVSQLSFEYIITLVSEEGKWEVVFDPLQLSISCSCRKSKTFGILCCHALKVFEANDVKLVLYQYILKRWTRHVDSSIMLDVRRNEVVGDPKLASTTI